MCASEREWLREPNTVIKARKKQLFVGKRKIFDKEIRLSKRRYKKEKDEELLEIQNRDQREFWRKIGSIGVSQNRQSGIPFEVKLEDGSISNDMQTVMNRWKNDFSNLLNPINDTTDTDRPVIVPNNNLNHAMLNDVELNGNITYEELCKVIKNAGNNKAPGHDDIPTEVLKNETARFFLLRLFKVCFQTSKAPTQWSKCTLNPIPKSSTSDKRDPLSYRGIALAPSSYKLFCGILNNRLVKWADANGVLADEQNGFRKGRSTVDHISSLTNMIETRKLKQKQTFVAFIDFRKAYDCIDRSLLWLKLEDLGIGGNILNVIKAMYSDVEYCVRLNGVDTEWFKVMNGLKQGCMLSPLLFNLFINNLVETINSLGLGVDIGQEKVSVLLYADDLVLVAETETDLQTLLNTLSCWCTRNHITVNESKSNIVHFRTPSIPRTLFNFSCCGKALSVSAQYNYLGLLLTEFLDFAAMATAVAKSASRALGLVIYICKLNGGLPFKCFTKLYDSLVWPIIEYGASIWGTTTRSCINAVQNRASRYHLGVGKYTPNLAVQGDIGWVQVRQWKSLGRLWCRFKEMPEGRINKRIFSWSISNSSASCKNCFFKFKAHMTSLNLDIICDENSNFSKSFILKNIHEKVFSVFKSNWRSDLDNTHRPNGSQSKLRSYKSFKDTFDTESYVLDDIPRAHRSALV